MANGRWGLPWVVLAAALVGGCGGPDIDTFCQEAETCRGGNEKDTAACVAAFEGMAERASNIGCGDEFDAFFECTLSDLSCRSTPIGMQCASDGDCPTNVSCVGGECTIKNFSADPSVTEDRCRAEENAYERCN